MPFIGETSIRTGASSAGGYTIDQSIRFNDDDNAYLTFTPSAGDSNTTWTFSCWYKQGNPGATVDGLFYAGANGNNFTGIRVDALQQIVYDHYDAGVITDAVKTTARLRDPAAWYHIVLAVDTTQGTAADRVKIYVNGSQITSFVTANYPSASQATDVGTNVEHLIGRLSGGGYALDGYLAEINFVDGQQLSTSDFGEYNAVGVWVPKAYSGTYGSNGFYITGEDSADLGADYSGNGNDFTSSGLTSDDQVSDTPTTNSCTMSPLDNGGAGGNVTLSDGNLVATATSSVSYHNCRGTFAMTTGKWYWEMAYTSGGSNNQRMLIGICDNTAPIYYAYERRSAHIEGYTGIAYYKDESASIVDSGTYVTFGNGDHIMFAFDADAGKLWFGKNGTWMGTGDPAAGTNASLESIPTGERWQPLFTGWFGNEGTFYFLEDTWTYTAPTGFNALNTANLPTPAIADGSAYFQTTTYTGDGNATQTISQSENSTFNPDLVWIKNRSNAYAHNVNDAVRGYTGASPATAADVKVLATNATDREGLGDTLTTAIQRGFVQASTANGFIVNKGTAGSQDGFYTNASGHTYAAWQWKANGSGSINTDGSITSTVSVADHNGFAIIKHTNTSGDYTVGHGMGQAPDMLIQKGLGTQGWLVWTADLGVDGYLALHATDAVANPAGDPWSDTSPTSSVFTIAGTTWYGGSSFDIVTYAFAEVEGFSKFGKYTGNGSTDGPFVWTGFKPSFIMTKRTDSTSDWHVWDGVRNGFNPVDDILRANTTAAEASNFNTDFTSNGWKLRDSGANQNASGGTYIFMAFAEHPFGGDGVASATAR